MTLPTRKSRLLHDTLARYVRHQAWSNLDRMIGKTRNEELANVMTSMAEPTQLAIFSRIQSAERQAAVIVAMQPPFGQRVLDPMPAAQAASILKEMAADDMADIIADLAPDKSAKILEVLEESEAVEDLLQYHNDTAGGIMVPQFVALSANDTAEDALIALRDSADIEMVYYIYVVDQAGHLVGVLSLRKLVVAPAYARIRDIMETEVISVTTDTDQELVARFVADYGLMAIPVVDDTNKLLGLVTVDDVIDVLKEEANEDFMKMAGAGTSYPGRQRKRLEACYDPLPLAASQLRWRTDRGAGHGLLRGDVEGASLSGAVPARYLGYVGECRNAVSHGHRARYRHGPRRAWPAQLCGHSERVSYQP